MPQISHIKHSDIKLAQRFDAEYFKPELLRIEKMISSINTLPLSDFVSSWYRVVYENTKILSDEEVSNSKAVNFLQASDISNYSLNYELKKVTYTDWERYTKWRIQHWEILIEVKGNIDKVAYVPQDFPLNTLVSGSLYKLTVNEKITPELLLIWLTCKYGDYLKSKLKRNVTIYFLWKDDLYWIPVPIFDDKLKIEITEIVKTAFHKQSDSKSLYAEAEQLLLSELGLIDYQVQNTLTFSTTRSAVSDAGRYDSEYFQPKYDEIIRRIEGYDGGCDTIGNIVKWKKGYEVGAEAYWDEGKDFIRVSDFTTHGISNDCKKIPESLFDELKKSYQPKKWEILFTKDGSIWITHVLKEEREWIVSWAFLRLTLKEEYIDFESECLALILNSMLCRMQVEKLSGGALIAHLKPSDFETFKIPLIKPSIQSQIAEKIQESHRLRKESRELLERAKKMVEDEIEKGTTI